jgi:hypothetical protein
MNASIGGLSALPAALSRRANADRAEAERIGAQKWSCRIRVGILGGARVKTER